LRSKSSRFSSENPGISGEKSPETQRKIQSSPQLTTNPELHFFPHEIGPTTAIDFSPLKKTLQNKSALIHGRFLSRKTAMDKSFHTQQHGSGLGA
jgi:hypothetical protein